MLPPGLSQTLREAAGVGFVAAAEEAWLGELLYVQAVGIPPWPGAVDPRVLALITPCAGQDADFPTLRISPGDATEPATDPPFLIAHVVNDSARSWGRRGFAGSLSRRYPTAAQAYHAWTVAASENLDLGNVHLVEPESGIWIASMVAQEGYGPSVEPRLRYPALASCLDRLRQEAAARGLPVYMPRIGTGQAGGNWQLIADEIDRHLCAHGIQVTVYSYGFDTPRRGTSRG